MTRDEIAKVSELLGNLNVAIEAARHLESIKLIAEECEAILEREKQINSAVLSYPQTHAILVMDDHGLPNKEIAARVGVIPSQITKVKKRFGRKVAVKVTEAERVEIRRRLDAGDSYRSIGRIVKRGPQTIMKEAIRYAAELEQEEAAEQKPRDYESIEFRILSEPIACQECGFKTSVFPCVRCAATKSDSGKSEQANGEM